MCPLVFCRCKAHTRKRMSTGDSTPAHVRTCTRARIRTACRRSGSSWACLSSSTRSCGQAMQSCSSSWNSGSSSSSMHRLKQQPQVCTQALREQQQLVLQQGWHQGGPLRDRGQPSRSCRYGLAGVALGRVAPLAHCNPAFH